MDRKTGETLVVAGDALVLMNESEDRMPVRRAGKRVVPGDDALFTVAAISVLGREERVVMDRETSSERYGEEYASADPSNTEGSLPSAGRNVAPHLSCRIQRLRLTCPSHDVIEGREWLKTGAGR